MPSGNYEHSSQRAFDSDASVGVILSNLAYIEKELPNLQMDVGLRQHLLSWCADFRLQATGLRSMLQVLEDGAGGPGEAVKRTAEAVHTQVEALHKLVISLRDLAASDPGSVVLTVLFNESGANILLAYREILNHLGRMGPA